MLPILTSRRDKDRDLPVLVWRFDSPRLAISSAALGGGIGPRHWVTNVTVPLWYERLDPDVHLGEVASSLGLTGPGVGLMTALDVTERVTADEAGVVVTATVGLHSVTWAAAPDGQYSLLQPGTINVVAHLPVRLSDAALVNAVVTATEAKVQALHELKINATGTATDVISVVCPLDGPAEAFGGPRSTWGARLARAVHAVVRQGAKVPGPGSQTSLGQPR